jgi:hypothetical protein
MELKQKQKANSTLRASRAVPHPSTDRAFRRLTSEFGWDRVCSTKYGRWRMLTTKHRRLHGIPSERGSKNGVEINGEHDSGVLIMLGKKENAIFLFRFCSSLYFSTKKLP